MKGPGEVALHTVAANTHDPSSRKAVIRDQKGRLMTVNTADRKIGTTCALDREVLTAVEGQSDRGI